MNLGQEKKLPFSRNPDEVRNKGAHGKGKETCTESMKLLQCKTCGKRVCGRIVYGTSFSDVSSSSHSSFEEQFLCISFSPAARLDPTILRRDQPKKEHQGMSAIPFGPSVFTKCLITRALSQSRVLDPKVWHEAPSSSTKGKTYDPDGERGSPQAEES